MAANKIILKIEEEGAREAAEIVDAAKKKAAASTEKITAAAKVFRRLSFGVTPQSFSRLRVIFSRSVEDDWILLGSFEALAFDGMYMQQFGTLHVLYLPEGIHKLDDIVPVDWAKISDVQTLKDVLLTHEQRFEGVVEAQDLLPSVVT